MLHYTIVLADKLGYRRVHTPVGYAAASEKRYCPADSMRVVESSGRSSGVNAASSLRITCHGILYDFTPSFAPASWSNIHMRGLHDNDSPAQTFFDMEDVGNECPYQTPQSYESHYSQQKRLGIDMSNFYKGIEIHRLPAAQETEHEAQDEVSEKEDMVEPERKKRRRGLSATRPYAICTEYMVSPTPVHR
jgi:hypothetical protein